ncbi:TldD protein [Ancylomarina subtilis]|uniref:TldD protein n=1 Tax=Ancylomarina subtilis TaxID=1639035 RepID=A0A4Q7VI95_9BACT|nr:TldD/PmbA family protein [Ancylomarina subtilis]RZT95774.1 TldD protein [Ancylomarina subtilis]
MNNEFSRREFIRTGSVSLAGMAILPSFLSLGCNRITEQSGLEEYYAHFNVDREMLQKVMAEALSRGGDYCDLYFEHSLSNNVGLQDKQVNSAGSNIDYGVGVRVLKGDQTGYAFSEEITLDAMKKVAKTAASIANENKKFPPINLQERVHPEFCKIKTSWEDVSIKQKIPYLQKLNDKVFSLDDKVAKVQVYLNDSSSYILFANSEGVVSFDYRPMVSFIAVCVMEKGDRREDFFASRSMRIGYEYINEELLDEIANEVVEGANKQFEAVKPKAGQMEVVLAAGGSGILLHEAMGHAFEADFNRKGTSIFSDKMGQKVGEDFVNIIDDGTNPNYRGTLNIDDEGILTQKTKMVENGVLTSYLHDRISAKHYNVAPTGNGRRESFRYAPIPRMRNTYMEAGPHSREDIISSVKDGIYVDTFTNGQVQIGAGDFTFYVKSGYLIENGKLTQPIKDVNLIGNGPEALRQISMVGNDLKIDCGTGTCGKGGQGVPVSMGLPTVKVTQLTVGGTNA